MALPEGFARMIKSYGQPQYDRLLTALADSAPEVSVRLNPEKYPYSLPVQDSVPWSDYGYYLPERPAFTFDPLIHQGAYYVQDASSMFIAHVAKFLSGSRPVRWLDACAAPGGKTTAVVSSLPQGSVVVANEFVRTRADILAENVAKWGYGDVRVTNRDTAWFGGFAGVFDIIAADVPCSGEGMMRKDEEAVAQWSPKLIETCVARQQTIISNLWNALKPGGYMVYSTCTFNRQENEEMVDWMRAKYGAVPVAVPLSEEWNILPGIDTDAPCYRFVPGTVRGEGLFMAVVRKPDDSDARQKNFGRSASGKTVPEVSGWLSPSAQVEVRADKDVAVALSTSPLAVEMPAEMRPQFTVARLKGRDYVPVQQLALSLAMNRDVWGAVEVDRLTALAYLRAEALRLPSGLPRGIVLLTYSGLPLGFVKNIGNRANNLYPDEWRIRSSVPAPLPPLPELK